MSLDPEEQNMLTVYHSTLHVSFSEHTGRKWEDLGVLTSKLNTDWQPTEQKSVYYSARHL